MTSNNGFAKAVVQADLETDLRTDL